ncbi:efflux RND transporter periplasmic adaptor subunit [Candidatus Arthromitus sp. SFB-rat-Yit]|uniref:efflux RND transporter periplasmic adaptor subunit n=1 Tax=Candidatus Arthromitus sp. SFB-rat-Yit TaxID=1041504 RepID=UPI000227A74B|nr:biotin/lipoyl-binding protein [Candidatus Arthromitus sp. SFB-rat-Yit]BAK80671.1 efflux transporter, RND family, MFP subunit [Candidatus Arthromitus sp. SFB-rat-Yit]
MILKRNSSTLFVVFLLIFSALIVLFLSSKVVKGIKFKNEINVRVCKVQSGNVQEQIDVKVFIKSKNYKEYYGNQLRVKKLYVRHGDYVEKGQKLLSFDNNDIMTQYTQAKIQLENAMLQKNQMIITRDNFKKQRIAIQEEINRLRESQEDNESFIAELEESFEDKKAISSKNSLTLSDYSDEIDKLVKESEGLRKISLELERQMDNIPEITDDQIKLLDNAIVLAESSLKNISDKIEISKDITADFSGVITSVKINEGSYTQPGSVILVLQDLQNVKGISLIPQQNISSVKIGQEIVINDPIGVYNGKIISISDLAVNSNSYLNIVSEDMRDNYLVADIEILNPNDKLKVDFDLNGKINLDNTTDILRIPIECVLYDESNTPYVFIVKNDIAYKNTIYPGRVFNNYIEIVGGLTLNDSIILNPPKNLSNSSKVKVVSNK